MGRAPACSASFGVVTDDVRPIPPSVAQPRESSRGSLRPRAARLTGVRLGPVLYAGAAVSYVALGIFVTDFMLSWVVGFAWLLLWVWGLPAAFRRLRR
jgi:hypothetical protein